MTEAQDTKSTTESTHHGEHYRQCYCMDAREMLSRVTEVFGIPEDVSDHFRQARIEVLKGIRGILDHRIERLSRMNRKGTRVTVE